VPTFKVVELREIRSIDPANETGADTLITFTNEAHRIDTVTIPGRDPDDKAIAAAVQTRVESTTRHNGREISF
jgi:hypothetical protein